MSLDDLDRYRLPADSIPSVAKPRRQLPRHQPGELFLRGPIPLVWLRAATELPGKALAVGVALWFQAGMVRQATVKATPALSRQIGLNRWAWERGLKQLEAAGLIEVERHRGKSPVITIVELRIPIASGT